MIKKFVSFAAIFLSASALSAQDNFFQKWEARTTATQSKQPAWSPPLATTFVGLIQVARADFTRQITPTRTTTWNYDTSKGLNLIPWANTEIDFNLPPYLTHSAPATKDGAGDTSFCYKYRFMTGDASHGNYVISAFVLSSIPTGSYKNGSVAATVAPNLALGKGFGNFNVQSTLGITLPTSSTTKLGRPIAWNTTGQYHLYSYFWPEVEFNLTHYQGGANAHNTQVFATPGITVGRIKLRPADPKSRLGLGFGGGMQIATSEFHTYNHALIFTGRLLF